MNLICGINPLVISKIRIQPSLLRARKCHPIQAYFARKKHEKKTAFQRFFAQYSFNDQLWIIDMRSTIMERPYVAIHGADGGVITQIPCKSAKAATELGEELFTQWKAELDKSGCKFTK